MGIFGTFRNIISFYVNKSSGFNVAWIFSTAWITMEIFFSDQFCFDFDGDAVFQGGS